jgi:hypothetical protein
MANHHIQRIIIYVCGLLCLMLACQIGAEQVADSEIALPAPVGRARWGEDWSVLRYVPLSYEDPSLAFKYIPLNESGTNYLSLGGEFRFTYENYDPVDRGLSDIGEQDVALIRLAAHADWHPNQKWRVFGQLGYAAAGDREGGNKVGDESDLNIWQLFVDRHFTVSDGEQLEFRFGRQFIEKADWFIGSGEARNVRQYYDGLRAAWLDKRYSKFDAFAAEFVDAATGSFDMSGNGEYFWGASAGFRLDRPRLNLSLLYFGWDLKDREFEQGSPDLYDETRHSIVLWAKQSVNASNRWDLNYYLVYQFGNYYDSADSDIKAFAAFGEFKYELYPRVNTPIFGLKTSYFSGDDDPNDNELNTFYNPIFVTIYFSYARDVMPYNLMHLQPNIAYRFNEELQLTLSNDYLWRASTNDAFYTGANKIGVPANASDSSYIGNQAQLALNWRPARSIVTTMHYVRFWAGDVVEDAGGVDQDYVRVDFNYLF